MRIFQSKNSKILAGLSLLLLILAGVVLLRQDARLISVDQLETLRQKKLITRVRLKEPYLYVSTRQMRYRVPVEGVDLRAIAREYPLEVQRPWETINWGLILLLLLLMGLAVVIYLLSRRERREESLWHRAEGAAYEQKRPELSEEFTPTRTDVTFDDVAGIEEVKEDLEEIIDFLKRPQRYKAFDIRLPKGVLLVGPPGVGKTLIAKAVAGEAGVPFFYQSGANIVEIYVGMGAKRVHELFQAAKRSAPSIVFIDEIDAVGRHRGSARNEEREATLNQLLTEMDGFESDSGIIVIAATNRVEMLDEALLRPGRFDRRVYISLPDYEDRRKILELYLRRKPARVDLEALARSTVGLSASALATLVNEAALHALRRGSPEIEEEDFEAVREQVVSGKRRILSLDETERKIQAVYQSGKAVAATWLDVPFEKIGMVTTRMGEKDHGIVSRRQMTARIQVLLAGSVATEAVFSERFSNGAEDRHRARKLIETMLYDYGLSEEIVPPREEAERLLRELYEQTRELLQRLEEPRRRVERWLLERENIRQEEVQRIIRDLL